jgi:hypothetical protein
MLLNLLSIIDSVEKKTPTLLPPASFTTCLQYKSDLGLSAPSFLAAKSVGGLILGLSLQDRETTAKVLNSEPFKGNCL